MCYNSGVNTPKVRTTPKNTKGTSVLAKLDDGSVQITLTISKDTIQAQKEKTLKDLVGKVEIPGFRKGKAPDDLAAKRIDTQDLYNQMLGEILPEIYADAVEEYKIKPILAPRFEIISINENDEWVIRALTCEIPPVDLGNYKEAVKSALAKGKIWVPGKDEKGKDGIEETSREAKEQEVLKTLILTVKAKIPQLLIDEEVNHKLARLLDQTQKLGLSVEQYLSSIGKTVETLKAELGKTAEEAIRLELALNRIAGEENITVSEKEVEDLIHASGGEEVKEALSTPQQRQMISSVLKRRGALDRLVSLV